VQTLLTMMISTMFRMSVITLARRVWLATGGLCVDDIM
jgi:hypothetical protein